MLSPHTITLSMNIDGQFVCRRDDATNVDAYVRAMRVVQQRSGLMPRAILTNHAPVHVRSEVGALTIGRVSGIPHQQDAARAPVPLADNEQMLFMQRGDHCLFRTDLGDDYYVTYAALTYDVIPTLLQSDSPIVIADPLRAPVGDVNALRLLELVRERELTATEQFFVALTMTSVWQRYCGQPVAAVIHPTTDSARECISFAQHFTAPDARLQQLQDLSSAWRSAFRATGEREMPQQVPQHAQPPKRVALSLAPETVAPAHDDETPAAKPERMRM